MDNLHSPITPLPARQSRLSLFPDRVSRWPWWALVAALIGVLFAWLILTDQTYLGIITRLSNGIIVTIRVTIIAYIAAAIIGLIVALGRVSNNVISYQVSTFYMEIIRGVPTLVLLLYIAFVMIPLVIDGLNALGKTMMDNAFLAGIGDALTTIRTGDVENELRGVIALTIAYSAFLAEIFRAGIELIEPGQMEAARALGMTYWQAMRHVILRQAVRRVLPPLGNDFIAMLKDLSLVFVLGVLDITRRGTLDQARTFQTLQTYNVVAFMYLTMTLLLSMVVKVLERSMARERRQE